jgi:hypothetical protein
MHCFPEIPDFLDAVDRVLDEGHPAGSYANPSSLISMGEMYWAKDREWLIYFIEYLRYPTQYNYKRCLRACYKVIGFENVMNAINKEIIKWALS